MVGRVSTTVVTGFHPGGAELGKSCMKSFDRWWPTEVGMVVYTEEPVKETFRAVQRSLWDIRGMREFIDAHDDLRFHGLTPMPSWNKKEYRANYSWRYDVVKFSRQMFIPEHAASFLPDGDILSWMDADVVSYAEVPGSFIRHLLQDKSIVTVGRDRGCTDIGFWAVRLTDQSREFLKAIADAYRNGHVFNLYEWHSGFVFDHYLGRFIADGKLTHRNLTPHMRSGHVWFDSDIGKYTDHLKGPHRKTLGYSPERPGR